MASVSQIIADLLLARDIDLMRVESDEEARLERAVRALTGALITLLIRSDPTEPIRPAFRQQRLDRIIESGRREIREAYRAMYREVRRDMVDLALDESEVFRAITNQGISVNVVQQSLDSVVARDIIDARVFTANANDADTLRGFFEREAAAHHKRFSGALRQGFSSGDTLSQLTARLSQLDGVQMREATVVARTAYNHVTSQVRIEMQQRNANLFRGVIAVAVLDGKTTKICIARSNGMWDLNTGRPLPESPVQTRFPGPTPWHMGERTHLYPLTRTARQIGRSGSSRVQQAIASLTPEQRRLLNADPPILESYPDWLRSQPEAIQVQVLGRTRRELWLQGKLNLRDMITQRGRPLTLKELARRRQAA